MSAPGGDAGADADLAEVDHALTEDGPGRIVALIGVVRSAVVVLCVGAALTAVVALALGVAAWRHQVPGLVVALALGAIGTILPLYVARRSVQLAAALARPDEVVAQARDLVTRAKGSPELGALAATIRRRRGSSVGRGRGASRGGRLRRAVASGRTVSAVIGLAQPDPVRHSHLVAFTPERLRNLWLATVWSLWAWLATLVLAVVAVLVLLTHRL